MVTTTSDPGPALSAMGTPPAVRSAIAPAGHAPGTEALTHVKSVAKAARILRCFDSHTSALTVRDIATRTGLPRSTCHAICSTLVAENMLEARSAGGYVLGMEMMVMGGHVVARSGLLDAATPAMNALAASTSGEVQLGQLNDDGCVVYLHRVRSSHGPRTRNWFGLRVPAYATGCGKAALSVVEPERARDMALMQGLTVEGAEQLIHDLELVRRTGFVVTTSSRTGSASVAAPIAAPNGRVLGGLSIAVRRETLTRMRVITLGSSVRDAAGVISRELVGFARAVKPGDMV